jgi:hypothetical protein
MSESGSRIIQGDKALKRKLDSLTRATGNKIMRPAITKGLRPIKQDAQRRAKEIFKSDTISKLIGQKTFTTKKTKEITGKVYIKEAKDKNSDGESVPKRTIKINGREVDFAVAANIQEFGRKDGSLAPHPFMIPAMESQKATAVRIITADIKKNLKKVVKELERKGKQVLR